MKHSGLQKDVLSLYRQLLRQCRPTALAPLAQSRLVLREEFRGHADPIKRSDFMRIEYLLRKGHKRVKLMQMEGVKGVGITHHEEAK